MILISAMTRSRVIGKGAGLPWDLPEEYAHFLEQVRGQPVILGRRSYEIFGRDLAASPLVVVSSTATLLPVAAVCRSVEAAVERARTLGPRIFSAGGAAIYRQTLPLADTLYLSIVKGDHEGDTYFPEFDEHEWTVTRRDDHPRFEFRVYERGCQGGGPSNRMKGHRRLGRLHEVGT